VPTALPAPRGTPMPERGPRNGSVTKRPAEPGPRMAPWVGLTVAGTWGRGMMATGSHGALAPAIVPAGLPMTSAPTTRSARVIASGRQTGRENGRTVKKLPLPMHVGLLASLGLTFAACSMAAESGPTMHLEGGLGFSDIRPLPSPTTIGATLAVGAGFPARPARFEIEFARTVDGQFENIYIPEGPFPGRRSLTTFLVGLEAVERIRGRGFFATAGIGLGRATLTGAKQGWQQFGQPGWAIPDRDVLGFAFGAGAGVRSPGGRWLGVQLALRFHALAEGRHIAASGTAITVGLAH